MPLKPAYRLTIGQPKASETAPGPSPETLVVPSRPWPGTRRGRGQRKAFVAVNAIDHLPANRTASSSKVGSTMSTRLSVSMNTVRVRARSPFQPRGRKLASNANYRSLIQPVSAGTRKVVSSRTASVSGATVFKSGATCFGGGPPQARITKFARGTMSFECCFVDRTRRKNAANCLDANLSVP